MSSIARSSQIRSSSVRCSAAVAAPPAGGRFGRIGRHLCLPFVRGPGRDLRPAPPSAAVPGSPIRPLDRGAGRAYSLGRGASAGGGRTPLPGRWNGAWLARMRWRRRGAWLLPAFVVATVSDAVDRSPAAALRRDADDPRAALLAGWFLNLLAVLLLGWPLGALLRRARPDLPRVVARDYAGTTAVTLVAVLLLVLGLLHRPSVIAHRRTMKRRDRPGAGVHR